MYELETKINEIINSVPENLSEMEIVRYVYLSLGKILVADTHFSYGSTPELKRAIYEKGKKQIIPDTNEIICNSGSELLAYILQRLGINATTYYTQEDSHAETIIHTSNNKMYALNLVGDLSRIQTGRRTKYFAIGSLMETFDDSNRNRFYKEIEKFYNHPLNSLSKKELNEFDNKLGYTINGLYTEDVIFKLKDSLVKKYPDFYNGTLEEPELSRTRKRIVDFLLNNVSNLTNNNCCLGFRETIRFHWSLFKSILAQEIKNLKLYSCYFNGKTGNNQMISLISLYCNNNYSYYFFNNRLEKYIEISPSKVKYLLDNGLIFDSTKPITGFRKEDLEK